MTKFYKFDFLTETDKRLILLALDKYDKKTYYKIYELSPSKTLKEWTNIKTMLVNRFGTDCRILNIVSEGMIFPMYITIGVNGLVKVAKYD